MPVTIKPGMQFMSIYYNGVNEVVAVDEAANTLDVLLPGGNIEKGWNLEHTLVGFKRKEYHHEPLPYLSWRSVKLIFEECLFQKTDPIEQYLEAQGVAIRAVGFNKKILLSFQRRIAHLLLQLPDQFQQSKGGGFSFMAACETRDGHQWGQHEDIEHLLLLGLATGMVTYLFPRSMWQVLPGGMPYFVVKQDSSRHLEAAIKDDAEAHSPDENEDLLKLIKRLPDQYGLKRIGANYCVTDVTGKEIFGTGWYKPAGALNRFFESTQPQTTEPS